MVWIADEIMLMLYFCPPDEEAEIDPNMLRGLLTGDGTALELPSVMLSRFFVNLPIEGDYAVLTRAMRLKAARILLERNNPDVLKSVEGTVLLKTIEEEDDADKGTPKGNTQDTTQTITRPGSRARQILSGSEDKDSAEGSTNDSVGGA